MPKTYSPFLELTRTDPVEGLSEIALINVDSITLIQCLADGKAKVYFTTVDAPAPQFMVPVENYAWFVTALTELTQAAARPAPQPQPAKRKRKPK